MAAIRDSLQEGETEDIPVPNMNAQPPRIQAYDQVIKVLKKFLIWILSVSAPIVMAIMFIIVFSSLQHQVDMGAQKDPGDGEDQMNVPIIYTTEPTVDEQSAHVSIESYDNYAVHQYVTSLRELQKQQRLKESYNYILQNVYSKDDEEAVQRHTVRKRKFLVANDEELPGMVSVLAKKLVKKLNKDDTRNIEALEDATDDLNAMIEQGAKKYGDETQVIGLNTNIGGTSTFLLSIFATKKISPTEREVDILMIVEEWKVKDGYKINGACKDGDEMCWSDVRITEFLQYQMFHDYMPEIKGNIHENTTHCPEPPHTGPMILDIDGQK